MLGLAIACPTRQHAAWFEIVSQDLDAQKGAVKLSISEYNEPWDGKTQTPKAYSGGAYVTPSLNTSVSVSIAQHFVLAL